MSNKVYPGSGGSYVRLASGELQKIEETPAKTPTPVATDSDASKDADDKSATPKAAKSKAQA